MHLLFLFSMYMLKNHPLIHQQENTHPWTNALNNEVILPLKNSMIMWIDLEIE